MPLSAEDIEILLEIKKLGGTMSGPFVPVEKAELLRSLADRHYLAYRPPMIASPGDYTLSPLAEAVLLRHGVGVLTDKEVALLEEKARQEEEGKRQDRVDAVLKGIEKDREDSAKSAPWLIVLSIVGWLCMGVVISYLISDNTDGFLWAFLQFILTPFLMVAGTLFTVWFFTGAWLDRE